MKSISLTRITALTLFAVAIALLATLVIPDRLAAKPPQPGASAISRQHTAGRSPNQFLNELAYEHAYPAAPSHPYVRTIAPGKAFEAFKKIRSGNGHGRAGIWRTVGPATVLTPADPATPGAAEELVRTRDRARDRQDLHDGQVSALGRDCRWRTVAV